MKPWIGVACVCFIIASGMAFCQEQVEMSPSQAIVGKWKSGSNIVYEFTADKKVLKSGKDYATYRFLEDVLVMKYEGEMEAVTGLKFGVDYQTLELTEFVDNEDSHSVLFRRSED